MNKILCAVIGAMWLVIFAVGSWWVKGVEEDRKALHELLYRDKYLHGDIPAAPITVPVNKPN